MKYKNLVCPVCGCKHFFVDYFIRIGFVFECWQCSCYISYLDIDGDGEFYHDHVELSVNRLV